MTVGFLTPGVQAGTTWDGGGGDTNINTANNWDGNVVNALNGTTAAIFGTGGSTATINTNASFTGITINRNAAFTIANGSGSLTVGSGGITTSNAFTHVISESSLVLGANQIWNIGSTQLDVTGVVSGASRSITKTGTGTLRLTGANTFSGGLSVDDGTVLAQSTGSALGGSGTGAVNLASTSAGTNNVTLALGTSSTFNNPITVRSGNSGTVTINNYAAYSPTLGGQITLNKGLILNNNDSSFPFTTLTVSGNITGGSGLTITGSNIEGETILSNVANDYTGTTAVNSGTLRLTGNLANTAVTVASGAAIAGEGSIGATGSLTFVNGSSLKVNPTTTTALTVVGNLAFGDATNVILDTAPTTVGLGNTFRLLNYNGTLSGSLTLQNASDYRNPSISTATANQINMTIDTKSLTWSGANGTWDINGSTNWDSNTEKFYQGDAVTFNDTGSIKAVTLGVSVIPASVTFNNSIGNDYSLTGTGAIAGTTSLTKTDTGTVTLSTNNTYSGGTTISEGKIVAAVANALGAGAVTNNAILDLTAAGAVTYSGISSSMSGNGTVNVTLPTVSTDTASLIGNYSGFTGTINIGIGAAAGAGKVQMTGADNALASINVLSNGTLYVNANVTKNATVTLNGGDTGETQGQLRLEGGATWAGNVILAGDITGAGDFTVGSNSGGGNISGNISETGGARALSKGGASTLTLSGSNSYTGATTVGAGTLKLGSAGALGNATVKTSGVTVSGSGIFDLGGFAPTAGAVPLVLNSTANGFDTGAFLNSGAAVTYSGSVTMQQQTRFGGTGAILLTGAITGGGFNFIKDSTGLLELQNSGTVTLGALQGNRGTVQVDSGTTLNVTSITVGSGNSVGSGLALAGGAVTSSGPALFGTATSGTASGTLTLNSGTLTVPSLAKGGTAGASVQFNANFNGGTLKANADSATFFTGANNAKVQAGGAVIDDGGYAITIGQALIHDTALDNPSVTADGGLTKLGAGNLTLAGVSTYTGNTTATNGNLIVSGSGNLTGTSKVIVTGGSLLVGANEVINNTANVTLSGGTLGFASGLGNATETLGALTLTANSTIDFGAGALANSTHKFIFNSLAGLDTYYLKIYNWKTNEWFGGGSTQLIFNDAAGANLSHFAFYSDAGTTAFPSSGIGMVALSNPNEIVAVPEPGTILAGAILLGGLAFVERKRLRKVFVQRV